MEYGHLDVGADGERIDEIPLAADPRDAQFQKFAEAGLDLKSHPGADGRFVPESEMGRVPLLVVIAAGVPRAHDPEAGIAAAPIREGSGLRTLGCLAQIGQLARELPLETPVA